MRITDMPHQLRPRERLLTHGASALTDAKLLAVLLRTGVTGVSAVELGQSLIDRFGSLQQRALTGLLMQQPVLDSVDHVSMYLRHRFNTQLNERFIGLFTDVQHRLLAVEDFGSGALQRVAVYPREIVRTALKHNAAGVVFAHNHPSGRAEPSELDKTLTKKLAEAMRCIEVSLLDHLIVTPEQIWSFRANGLC